MNMSDKGIAWLRVLEGCELTVYLDSVGIPTVGVGHVCRDLKVGTKITQEQADKFLVEDLEIVDNALANIPLEQQMYDALAAFVFNVGVTAFKKSTLRKYLSEKKYAEASDELLKWCKGTDPKTGEKITLNGLKNRREKEKKVFDEGLYS